MLLVNNPFFVFSIVKYLNDALLKIVVFCLIHGHIVPNIVLKREFTTVKFISEFSHKWI